MSYVAEISRRSPAAVVLLLDQSESMSGVHGLDTKRTKASVAAELVNRWLMRISVWCAKEDGIRDYFHVAVLGYADTVKSAFGPKLPDQGLIPISRIAQNPDRVEEKLRKVDDGAGGLIERPYKLPIWVDPVANGSAGSSAALDAALSILRAWVSEHPDSFPPLVVITTDGCSIEETYAAVATEVREVTTTDGDALLVTCHVSEHGGPPTLFPPAADDVPDEAGSRLADSSSHLPEALAPEWPPDDPAGSGTAAIRPHARCYAYQADPLGILLTTLAVGARWSV